MGDKSEVASNCRGRPASSWRRPISELPAAPWTISMHTSRTFLRACDAAKAGVIASNNGSSATAAPNVLSASLREIFLLGDVYDQVFGGRSI